MWQLAAMNTKVLRNTRPWSGPRAVMALILREISTTYGRSPGGYLWAVLMPVAGVMVLTTVFSFMLRSPPLGSSFALFYASGLLILMLYSDLTMKLGQAIRFSRPLLAYPGVNYVDALLSRFLLNMLSQIIVLALIFGGMIQLLDLRLILDFGAIARALTMVFALCFGIGVMNCFLMSRFPVWMQIWSILNRPMFIISGVFFVIDELPAEFRDLLMLNPLAHVISEFRAGFYVTYDAPLVSPLYVYVISLVLTFFGFLLLYRYNRKVLDEGA